MNYLAHLYLSRPTVPSRVGNLLGDYRRGTLGEPLSPAVRRGLENHHAVDAFTDRHPLVREARGRFSARRRRFAGIALDVLFDHFLIRHWERFATTALDDWIDRLYRDLRAGRPLMPAAMGEATERMVRRDLFRAYGELETVGHVLDRLAARIRFENRFHGVIGEIRDQEQELEAVFLEFFPQLVRHIDSLAIEADPPD